MSMQKMGTALLAIAASAVLATQPATTSAASLPTVADVVATPAKTLTVTINGATTAPRNTSCLYTAQVSGGTPPYSFGWVGAIVDGWDSQTATARWASAGETALWVDVVDSQGTYGAAFKWVIVVNTGSC